MHVEIYDDGKEVSWHSDYRTKPTLAEIIEAAKKEFPDVPLVELRVSATGYDAETIVLKRKGFF